MTDHTYIRPLVLPAGEARLGAALAGTWARFDRVEIRNRAGGAEVLTLAEVERQAESLGVANELEALLAPRADFSRLSMDRFKVMGIVNVTPDSFSDGGDHQSAEAGVAHGLKLAEEGASILDVGGESTRPGADPVAEADEVARTSPVIEGLRASLPNIEISIDTRHAPVMRSACSAGASIVNDVTALTDGPDSLSTAAALGVPVMVMHMQGKPQTMQANPTYEHVLFDVYDYFKQRVEACVAAGIERANICIDPGIGFGKTLEHNLILLRGLSLFHGLGCAILIGTSRKRMIETIAAPVGETLPEKSRVFGSLSTLASAHAQGVQLYRVHDVAATVQYLKIAEALAG